MRFVKAFFVTSFIFGIGFCCGGVAADRRIKDMARGAGAPVVMPEAKPIGPVLGGLPAPGTLGTVYPGPGPGEVPGGRRPVAR